MATKWEYKIDSYPPDGESYNDSELEAALNKFGHEGWELASMIEHGSGEGTDEFMFVFKRPTT